MALIHYFDWKPLSAYSLSCVITVQVNNAILMLNEGGLDTDGSATAGGTTTSVAKKEE